MNRKGQRFSKPRENSAPGGPNSLVYGVNAVGEALRSRSVDYVVATEGRRNHRVQDLIDQCRAAGIPLRFRPRKALERLAQARQHQDIVAVCTSKTYATLESLVEGNPAPLLVVLDGVEDPRNLGAVMRTAAATGAAGLVIPERRSAGLSPAAAKASAGALEHLQVVRVTNLVRAIEWMKEKNIWVTGFEAQADTLYDQADFRGACALVFGGEGHGLRRLVRQSCDRLVSIPLRGPVSSLNVSVAAAVALYEALRQRTEHP